MPQGVPRFHLGDGKISLNQKASEALTQILLRRLAFMA